MLVPMILAAGLIAQAGTTVAAGDLTGDGVPDTVVGAGAGGPPVVKVIDGKTGQPVKAFMAFEVGFQGGVTVAVGDVNGDGVADIVVGAGPGGGPHVKVFDGKSGALIASWTAFDASFKGGVRVAAGDVNGDGKADITVTAGAQPGSAQVQVKVFDGATGALLKSYMTRPAPPGRH